MRRTCPVCGAHTLQERHGTYVFEWPEGAPVASSSFENATWEECESCHEVILSAELDKRIEEQQYFNEGLLSPLELKEIRTRLNLTQVAMADYLKVGEKTYARWEAGLSIQTRAMDQLIRLAVENPESVLGNEARRGQNRLPLIQQWFQTLRETKTQNQLAIAAHGDQPSARQIKAIRVRLRELLEERKETGDADICVSGD